MNGLPLFFLSLMDFVLHWEGLTFTGGKNDKGGATKYGVSLRFLKSIPIADADLNRDGVVTWADVYAMTQDQALGIFWSYFGSPLCVESWPKPLAAVLLDTAINCGSGTAVRWAQNAFNDLRPGLSPSCPSLLVDGGMGQKTRGALCAGCRAPGGAMDLALGILASRKAHYGRLNATGDPDYTANYQGWIHRAASLTAFIAGRPWRMQDKPWENPVNA